MTTAGIITIEVQGRDASLGDVLDRVKQQATQAERQISESMTRAGSAASNARSGFLSLQSAVANNEAATARAAAAAGNYTQAAQGYSAAIQRLETVLNAQNQTTTQTLGIERQLITLRQQAAKAAEAEANATQSLGAQLAASRGNLESMASGLTSLNSALGGVGIALGAQQLVSFGIDAAQSSLKLQQTENALRQIAGSQEVYNTILAAAKQQQIAFGGSLADNLGELSSFAVAARTTGADLQELIRTAQRLATLDPAQGIGGAKLALNEALSGNATSLNRRFEIPKAALDGLSDSSTTAAQKLAIVNQYLDQAGISAQGMADAIPQGTRAINEMNASLDVLKTNIGAGLAETFLPAVQGITQLSSAINGTVPAINGFVGAQQAANAVVQATGGFFGSVLGPINAYNNVVVNGIGSLFGYSAAEQTAAAGTAQHAQATAQAQAAMDPYVQSLVGGTTEAQNLTGGLEGNAQALVDQTQKSQAAALQTQQLAAFQASLANLAGAVAGGLVSDGAAAAQLAGQYGIATQAAYALIAAQAQLGQAKATIGIGTAAQAGAVAAGRIPTEDQGRVFDQLVASKKAQENYTLALGSASEKQALLQHRLDQTTRYLGANSAEAIKAKQALEQFNRAEEKANAPKKGRGGGGGGGGGGAVKLSDQAKLNNSLASNEARFNDQIEEAQITHGKNLQKIEQDYQDKISDIQLKALQKRKQQADANEIGKRSSELSFLEAATSSSLNGSKSGSGDLARIQQDYYKAFNDAQQAAQNGELEKSDRMLKAAEERANTELKYAEKLADLKDKMSEAHNGKERAAIQAQIGLQETLLTKARQIQDVKDQQNAAAPDAINATEQQDIQKALADKQQALTDETGRAADAMDKLTRALDNKNDLATGNALRAGKNVSGAPAGTSALDNSTPAPTTPAAPIPVAPVNTGSSAPLNTNSPDMVSAIQQLQAGFDAVVNAVNGGADKVASKIQNQRFEVIDRRVG